MNNNMVLIRKDLLQLWRCRRILILLLIAFFIAASSPILGKYMPDILEMISKSSGQDIIISFPEPTIVDAYAQLFKNMNSMGMFVIIFVFCSSILEERNNGSAVLVMTKNVSRKQFVLSKFWASVICFTGVYIILAFVFFMYSSYLFTDFSLKPFLLSFLAYYTFCFLVLGITTFAGVMGKSFPVIALTAFGCFFGVLLSGYIPYVKDYTPGRISGIIIDTLKSASSKDLLMPSLMAILLTLLLVLLAAISFNRVEDI